MCVWPSGGWRRDGRPRGRLRAGLKGNTHIPFADMNNVAVADLLSKLLAQNGLDER